MGLLDFLKNTFNPKDPQDKQYLKYEEEYVTFNKKELEKRQKERRAIELQWNLNRNFLEGNQYCDINLASGRVEQIEKFYDFEERGVYNQIAPIYETRLAKLKKVKPIPFVRPATSESNDLMAAKTSTYVARGLESKQRMEEKRAQMTAWAEICGGCFLKHVWNPNAGRLIGEMDGQPVYEGDIEKIVVPFFEVFPKNNYVSMDTMKDIMHVRAYSVDDIYDIWGVEVKGRKIDVYTLEHTNVGTGSQYMINSSYRIIPTQIDESEYVVEYTCLPCRKFPNGIVIITAGSKLLEVKEFTYHVGEDGKPGLNWEMQACINNPGRFWPESVITRLIPIQRAYNAVRNRKQIALNRKALGVLDIEDDGTVDIEQLEEEGLPPGKILVRGRGTRAAQFLRDGGGLNDFDVEIKQLEHEFERISGVSAFSSSSLVPTGVESGAAMEKIREMDDSRLSLTAENINHAAIQSFKIDLRMYKQFATGKRLLRYVGENNDVMLMEWEASDLQTEDIIVEKEDALSQTPTQRKMMAIQLMQYGLFRPDVDPTLRSRMLEIFELGNWEDADNVETLHKSRAMRENKLLEQGEFPMPDEIDDHQIHIDEHTKFMLDIRFEQIKAERPDIAYSFYEHLNMHRAIEAQNAQQAMMMQMMASGKAPPQIPQEQPDKEIEIPENELETA
jgi:hypothetical protein